LSKKMRAIITLLPLIVIWLMPVPNGLTPQAWHLFAIFMATVFGFVLSPIANGSIALMSLVFAILTGNLTLAQALSSFANSTVWLIVSAFLFAKGFILTGLGKRIAYIITRAFGDSTLKLAYSLAISDVIIGPATPSNTARAGGVLFPIVSSLCASFDSLPGPTAKKLGNFLMLSSFHVDIIVSTMFLTAMAANPLAAELAKKTLGVSITWGAWFQAAIVPGIIGLIVIPFFIYKMCPPELKKTPEAKEFAKKELEKMGPASKREKMMFGVFILSLILWATSTITKIDATTVALLGVCIMLATDVIQWGEVIGATKAWDSLVWVGAVVGLAGFLNSTGFIGWFAKSVAAMLVGTNWMVAFIVAVLVYMYSHYAFASMTAHVTAMYAALAAVAVAAGAPTFLTVLALAFTANICGCMTHYGTGPAPIYFGAGYVSQGEWWKIGFLVSVLHLVIWIGIGGIWWKILGLW
jgi:divalent anion:Na+ symporter, DASS family